jgi:hypothetical protein
MSKKMAIEGVRRTVGLSMGAMLGFDGEYRVLFCGGFFAQNQGVPLALVTSETA